MLHHVIADFESYFRALTADRRARPREDIATVIANATIDGGPIPDRELAGYYMIVATAGHDTTSASTAGAMMELAKNPALFARFRDAGADKAGLIEEAIRWSTPVQHFMRSARGCRDRRADMPRGRLADAQLCPREPPPSGVLRPPPLPPP